MSTVADKIKMYNKKIEEAEDKMQRAEIRLEEAQKQAKDEFGTSDSDELAKLLTKYDKELEELGEKITEILTELEEGYDWSVI